MTRGNSLFVIQPRLDGGMWVFDDATRGLTREPFVAGIPEMIEHFTKGIPNAKKGFNLIFSASPIPRYVAHLRWVAEVGSGNDYRLVGTRMVGWLCPALFKYFKKAPKNIYCDFQPMPRVRAAKKETA